MRQYQNAIRDVILRKLLNKHTKENSFTWNHDAVTSLTSRTNTGVDQGWRWRRDTRSREKDKYLLEQGFSPWSAIRAILTSPLLGRQKMPVSRCARLKNDRRGAKPGSTAPPLFLPLPLSLSFFLFLLVFLYLDPPLFCHPSPSLTTMRSFRFNTRKQDLPLFVAPNLRVPFFPRLLFSAFSSLLQDSLDSLGDYVSCYYSSRGTPPRIPSSPSPSFRFLLRRRCYSSSSSYRFIDLLSQESSARDKTSTVSAAYFYENENILSDTIIFK